MMTTDPFDDDFARDFRFISARIEVLGFSVYKGALAKLIARATKFGSQEPLEAIAKFLLHYCAMTKRSADIPEVNYSFEAVIAAICGCPHLTDKRRDIFIHLKGICSAVTDRSALPVAKRLEICQAQIEKLVTNAAALPANHIAAKLDQAERLPVWEYLLTVREISAENISSADPAGLNKIIGSLLKRAAGEKDEAALEQIIQLFEKTLACIGDRADLSFYDKISFYDACLKACDAYYETVRVLFKPLLPQQLAFSIRIGNIIEGFNQKLDELTSPTVPQLPAWLMLPSDSPKGVI